MDNSWFLGLVVFLVVFALRRLGFAPGSKQAIWLVFAVSVVLAILQVAVQGSPLVLPPTPSVPDPFLWGSWVGDLLGNVAAAFGQILAASQVIYVVLKAGVDKWYPQAML